MLRLRFSFLGESDSSFFRRIEGDFDAIEVRGALDGVFGVLDPVQDPKVVEAESALVGVEASGGCGSELIDPTRLSLAIALGLMGWGIE